MTDMELAEEIERRRGGTDMLNSVLMPHQWEQIIAALRRADLSQTEIKGHMRVEEELRAELLVVQPKAQVMHDLHDALGVKWGCDPYAEIRRLKRFEKFCEELLAQNTEAQARIAELEKVLVCAHALCDEFSWSLGMDDSNPMKGTGNRLADAVAALKSRV